MKNKKVNMEITKKTKKKLWAEYFVDGDSIFVALEDVDSKDKKVYELKSLVVEDELGYALVKSDMEYDKKKFNIKRKAYNSYTAKNICRDRDTGELLPVHVIVLELPATFEHKSAHFTSPTPGKFTEFYVSSLLDKYKFRDDPEMVEKNIVNFVKVMQSIQN